MNKEQWQTFLKLKSPTEEEWQEAYLNANHWFCCALGSKLFLNPPNPEGLEQNCLQALNKMVEGSITPKAEQLGMEFFDAIDERDLRTARRIFKQIQELKVKKLA